MKILYIHGLSSSGNSGTAEHLRRLLPNDTIFSPDLPIEPMVADVEKTCKRREDKSRNRYLHGRNVCPKTSRYI